MKSEEQKSSLYYVWGGMRARCNNFWHTAHKAYGRRGIIVCQEWNSFSTFKLWAIANGYKPGLTLDRKNNDGNYCPENCRWVTRAEQALNTSRNRILTVFGESKTMLEWSNDPRCQTTYGGLRKRLNRGWSHEQAVTTKL